MKQKIRKRFLALVLAVVAAFSIVPTVTTRAANIVTGAGLAHKDVAVYDSIGGRQIGTIYKDEGFTILNIIGERNLYVEYSTANGAKRGYVYWDNNLGYWADTTYATVNRTTNTWYGGNADIYQISGTVYAGETVAVLALGDYWAYIEYNASNCRKRGYVPFIYLNCNTRPNFGPLPTDKIGYKVTSPDNFVVYTGPSKKFATVGSIRSGEEILRYEKSYDGIQNIWYISYVVDGTSQRKSGFIIF